MACAGRHINRSERLPGKEFGGNGLIRGHSAAVGRTGDVRRTQERRLSRYPACRAPGRGAATRRAGWGCHSSPARGGRDRATPGRAASWETTQPILPNIHSDSPWLGLDAAIPTKVVGRYFTDFLQIVIKSIGLSGNRRDDAAARIRQRVRGRTKRSGLKYIRLYRSAGTDGRSIRAWRRGGRGRSAGGFQDRKEGWEIIRGEPGARTADDGRPAQWGRRRPHPDGGYGRPRI